MKYTFLSIFGKDQDTVSARALAGAQLTDIVLTLDRSGSMCRDSHGLSSSCPLPPPAHEPMSSVKSAANGFADRFEPGYTRIGLVSFSSTSTIDLTASSNFGPGSLLESSIDAIYPGGSTNIGDAIADAHFDVMNGGSTRPEALKVIVLLSDGVPNRCAGGSSCDSDDAADYARTRAQAAAADGITIYTIGLGAHIDEDADAGPRGHRQRGVRPEPDGGRPGRHVRHDRGADQGEDPRVAARGAGAPRSPRSHPDTSMLTRSARRGGANLDILCDRSETSNGVLSAATERADGREVD